MMNLQARSFLQKKIAFGVLLFSPWLAFAAPSSFKELVGLLVGLLMQIIPILAAIVFLGFLYGLGKFIRDSGQGKSIEEAKNIMLWGIIIIFVMLSAMGIIAVLQNTFIK